MKHATNRRSKTTSVLALSLLTLSLFTSAEADDRDLFRSSSAEAPYLFILFDLSGSMNSNLAGRGTQLHGDDPDSRLFQAKEALDAVLQEAEGVNFGFASFPNHFRLRVNDIHQVGQLGQRISPFESVPSRWCEGIESNEDTAADRFQGSTFKQPTTVTPNDLEIGDLVPFNWDDDNVDQIRERLAPNLALGETDPDFGITRYFQDLGSGPVNSFFLPLVDQRARPLFTTASARTPLAAALLDFQSWYQDWRPKAIANDPTFASGCREVAVVLLTDGVETCNGHPVDAARALQRTGTDTFVIGFANNNPALDNIAAAGGTVEAYDASTQQELIDAFNDVLVRIQRQSRSFATAAVPSVIGTAAENIYLTSFSPTDDGVSLWPGRIDAYKKPVPLVDVFGQQVADRSQVCADPDTDENCLAWDAAAKLLEQAPDASEVNSDLKIGFAASQRRVYYSTQSAPSVPEGRRYFQFETGDDEQDALYGPPGFGFPLPGQNRNDFVDDGEDVIKYFLQEKQVEVLDPLTRLPIEVDYVLGDIFHSDPTIVAEPTRFDYFAKDLEGEIEPCGATNNLKSRYPCFVKNQLGRRRVFLAGSNEGALHAIDAGSAFRNSDGFLEYTAGDGSELFAYVPRAVMPAIRDMSEDGGQQFTVDGPVTVDDVLRDPEFGLAGPVPAEREWRTVVVGGLREGGRSYYALDVTQPDDIDSSTGLPIRDARGPGCTPDSPPGGCGRPYPEILWEFEDTRDEDNNDAPDLGFTWSKVNTGRVRLDDGTDADGNPKTKDMYVAVFGGGMDPDFKRNPIANPVTGKFEVSGNYLYMVDIETGELVYKRRIDARNSFSAVTTPASAPSEPAAVDTDQDSYLDTIFIGNTAGFLYKVDISEPVRLEEGITINDWSRVNPETGSEPFIETVDRIIDSRWEPFAIFSTGGRPLYYPPSVIFVPELARFAVAFGTGDREDLWSDDLLDGRFYVLLDNGLAPDSLNPGALPFDEADLEGFLATDNSVGDVDADLLAHPEPGSQGGYYLELENTERLITRPFGLSGVLFFSTYSPDTESVPTDDTCGSAGDSRLYSTFTTSGVGIRTSRDRYREVGDFVTQPFVESSGAADDPPSNPADPPEDASACDDEELQAIRTSLMSQLPSECKFAQYSLNVMTLQSQSGIECLVPIPVCVVERNWKEF